MRKLLRSRLALSTVVTTLIILVVSVLLAGVVTYFAINVVSTRVQQESLSLTNAHIWVNSTGSSEGAIMITNTGGRDAVISQIQVRGQACPLANIYYNETTIAPTGGLSYVASLAGSTKSAAALSDLILPSGSTLVVYIASPDSVTINDVGLSIGMTVFSAQAIYAQETNVQAAPGS